MSPFLGRGCNTALEDVAIFDELLDKYADCSVYRLSQSGCLYFRRIKRLLLSIFPKLGIEFVFKEKLAKTLPQLFLHRFVPSLMDLVFERKFSFLCRDFAI